MMPRTSFKTSSKMLNFAHFRFVGTHSSKKFQKMMIFHDFLKVVLIIIGGHPRYVQVSWGLREAIFNQKSHLSPLLDI